MGIRYYVASVGMAIGAMLSKENSITLPLAIIMVDLLFFAQKEKKWKNFLGWLPFLLTSLLPLYYGGVLTGFFQAFVSGTHKDFLPTDTSARSSSLPRGQYFLSQFSVLCTYLRLLIFPINQKLDYYDYPVAKSLFEFRALISFLFLSSLLGAAIFWIKKNRLLSFCVFWFFITLSVESSIIPIKDIIFEHRMYLPMAGCALFLCARCIS